MSDTVTIQDIYDLFRVSQEQFDRCVEDVDNFCQTLEHFKRAFPEHGNRQVYGAVAAIEIFKHVDRYAYRRGLFVIRQCGDSVEIANDERFRPAVW
jgi:hypothetical protein